MSGLKGLKGLTSLFTIELIKNYLEHYSNDCDKCHYITSSFIGSIVTACILLRQVRAFQSKFLLSLFFD